jgi:hypothetical protein
MSGLTRQLITREQDRRASLDALHFYACRTSEGLFDCTSALLECAGTAQRITAYYREQR